MGEETIEFENDYVVDYRKKEFICLSNRAVNWSLNSSLAFSDGLVLNMDPTNLEKGEWIKENSTDFYNFNVPSKDDEGNDIMLDTGIQKTGDVNYNPNAKSLDFNRSAGNDAGEGGYIKLSKNGEKKIDFKKGFSFEIYLYSERGWQGKGNPVQYANSLFCRMKSLGDSYVSAMRFGLASCKLVGTSTMINDGIGVNMHMSNEGTFRCDIDINDLINKDIYLTYVYVPYDKDNPRDDFVKENKVDRFEYYINGELYGYAYFSNNDYEKALGNWNSDDCPFFLGVCPWYKNGLLYYLKGKVYATRLYELPMTEKQVNDNYNMTLKYRASF